MLYDNPANRCLGKPHNKHNNTKNSIQHGPPDL